MLGKIVEEIKKINYIDNISSNEEKCVYNLKNYNSYIKFDIRINKAIFNIGMYIPNNWDRILVDFYIYNYKDICYLPHIEENGKVCLYQKEGILIVKDLLGITVQSINKLIKLICDGIEEKNKIDFISEFSSYWLLLPESKVARSMISQDNNTREIKVIYDKNENIYLADIEKDFAIYNKKNNTIYNAWYINIVSNKYIFPPDWRNSLTIEYINCLFSMINTKNRKKINKKIKKYIKNKDKILLMFNIEQPNKVRCSSAVVLTNYVFNDNNMTFSRCEKIIPLTIISSNREFLCERGGGNTALKDKKVLVIGCGSLGGYLISEISKSGINNIDIVDGDKLEENNIYRHILGFEYIGKYKSFAIQEYINKNIPFIKIKSYQSNVEESLENFDLDFKKYDLIISAVGNHNLNRWLNSYIFKENINVPLIYVWNEVLDIGSHISYIEKNNAGCYECFFENDYEIYDRTSYCQRGQNYTKNIFGCGSEFMPYSSSLSLKTVSYCIDIIKQYFENKIKENFLVSIKGDNYYYKKNGYVESDRYIKQQDIISKVSGIDYLNSSCGVCGELNE
jgi:molybdopterin/thiamine biosynthesis adenylyltransferase